MARPQVLDEVVMAGIVHAMREGGWSTRGVAEELDGLMSPEFASMFVEGATAAGYGRDDVFDALLRAAYGECAVTHAGIANALRRVG